MSPFTPVGQFSNELAAHYDLTKIDVGHIFREIIVTDSPLSHEIRAYMDSGNIVPPVVLNKVLEYKLDTIEGDVLFQGYPRTTEQYHLLTRLLEMYGIEINRIWQLRLTNYDYYISCQRTSENPYVKKFGVDEKSILDKVRQMQDTYKQIEQQVDKKDKLIIVEKEYPWEYTPEDYKKIISCA
jgi:adenylate kinase family enzyme